MAERLVTKEEIKKSVEAGIKPTNYGVSIDYGVVATHLNAALRAAPIEPTAAPPIYGHHCPTGEHTDKRCCQACDHDYPVECVCDEVAEHYAPPPERATRTAEELQAIDADVDEILGKRAADDVTSVLARVQQAFRALRTGNTR